MVHLLLGNRHTTGMALVVGTALKIMVNGNPIIKDKTLAVPKGLLRRHFFEILKNATLKVIDLIKALLFHIGSRLFAANTAGAKHGNFFVFLGVEIFLAKGIELRGKTIGIIGFGRIGQEVAKIALGVGMRVIAADKFMESATVQVALFDGQTVDVDIKIQSQESLLAESDFVSLHVPAQKDYVIGAKEFNQMKDGAAIVNAARGGVIDEVALLKALDSGKLSFAGLDTFEEEPKPAMQVLMHSKVSLTPHIGAATGEAQDRIGEELAQQIAAILI